MSTKNICKAIIKSGKNKGKICGNQSTFEFCGKHSISEEKVLGTCCSVREIKEILEQFTTPAESLSNPMFALPCIDQSVIISCFKNNKNILSILQLNYQGLSVECNECLSLVYKSIDGKIRYLLSVEGKDIIDEKLPKEIYLYVRNFLINLNNMCCNCYQPFDFESDYLQIKTKSHNLISNCCIDCGNYQIKQIS